MVETYGQNTSGTTTGTILTAPVSTNSKSAWTQIIAATTSRAQGFWLAIIGGGATADALLDIGIGPSNGEVIIVDNLQVRPKNTVINEIDYYYIPLSIPIGTRVALRYQATSTSAALSAVVYALNETEGVPFADCIAATTYGTNAADSGSTSIDAGGTANTKPATYTTITALTTRDINWLAIMTGCNNNDARNSAQWALDIATGQNGTEIIIIADLILKIHSGTDYFHYAYPAVFPVSIPAGTRLSARAQCTTNSAADRIFDLGLIGYSGFRRRSLIAKGSWNRWAWK